MLMGKDVTNSKMKDVKGTRKYQNDLKLIACNIKDHPYILLNNV